MAEDDKKPEDLELESKNRVEEEGTPEQVEESPVLDVEEGTSGYDGINYVNEEVSEDIKESWLEYYLNYLQAHGKVQEVSKESLVKAYTDGKLHHIDFQTPMGGVVKYTEVRDGDKVSNKKVTYQKALNSPFTVDDAEAMIRAAFALGKKVRVEKASPEQRALLNQALAKINIETQSNYTIDGVGDTPVVPELSVDNQQSSSSASRNTEAKRTDPTNTVSSSFNKPAKPKKMGRWKKWAAGALATAFLGLGGLQLFGPKNLKPSEVFNSFSSKDKKEQVLKKKNTKRLNYNRVVIKPKPFKQLQHEFKVFLKHEAEKGNPRAITVLDQQQKLANGQADMAAYHKKEIQPLLNKVIKLVGELRTLQAHHAHGTGDVDLGDVKDKTKELSDARAELHEKRQEIWKKQVGQRNAERIYQGILNKTGLQQEFMQQKRSHVSYVDGTQHRQHSASLTQLFDRYIDYLASEGSGQQEDVAEKLQDARQEAQAAAADLREKKKRVAELDVRRINADLPQESSWYTFGLADDLSDLDKARAEQRAAQQKYNELRHAYNQLKAQSIASGILKSPQQLRAENWNPSANEYKESRRRASSYQKDGGSQNKTTNPNVQSRQRGPK